MTMAASAATTASHFLRPLYPIKFPKCPHLLSDSQFRLPLLSSQTQRTTIRATSAVVVESDLSTKQDQGTQVDLFACPICYEPLIRKGPVGLNLSAIYRSGFKCKRCQKSYTSKDGYLDLTVTSGLRDYIEVQPFKMAQEYFKPAKGGLVVDVSCGSGLFSRKFAKSETYSGVIALDFSENMLRQCYNFIKKDDTLSTSNIALVRADISRLPFASGSVDAVHAGAALHCWPSPSNACAFGRIKPVRIWSKWCESGPNQCATDCCSHEFTIYFCTLSAQASLAIFVRLRHGG
ncbi:hypothetical protein TSUD_373520 [Trifolium subterraneum]|uniref:Methyltransferase domain-containing protein n=1 Tax=Trifolium subterraneum TaxID=3900 RepID=A0A2Z6PG64_TRISU|nr:hypothetical protein TSUD_373520 [Trifolium subterraneum]